MTTEQHILSLINAVICCVCIVICLCRLNGMNKHTKFWVACEYSIGVGALYFSAFRPWISEVPGYASIVVTAWILLKLLVSTPAWKNDEPPSIATDLTPLGDK